MIISDLEHLATVSQNNSLNAEQIIGGNYFALDFNNNKVSVSVDSQKVFEKSLSEIPSQGISVNLGNAFGSGTANLQVSRNSNGSGSSVSVVSKSGNSRSYSSFASGFVGF